MSNCYVCEQKILKNNTYNEHIVLNSLGGKLKSKKIICPDCAPSFDPIDKALSDLLNPIANQLNIKRDRGKPQNFLAQIEGKDHEVLILPGGKPRLSKPKIDDSGDELTIEVPNEKILRQILRGKSRKYPELTEEQINEIIKSANKEQKKTGRVYFNISFDDENLWRAICKMAISFYIHKGGERKYISDLIPYIKNDNQTKVNCVTYYYPLSNETYDYLVNEEKVVHSLLIIGDQANNNLYGIIQLFGSFRFLILLNDNYQGNNYYESYTFDVLERKEILDNFDSDLEISPQDIKDNMSENNKSNALFLKQMQAKINDLQAFIFKKQFFDNVRQQNREVIASELDKFSEGDLITEESLRNIAKSIAENFVRNLHNMNMLSLLVCSVFLST